MSDQGSAMQVLELMADRDRYREALERIKAGPYNGFEECKAIAAEALSQTLQVPSG